MPHPTIGAPDLGSASDFENRLVGALSIMFSIIVISGINIAVSGHILGYIFNLTNPSSSKNTFSIRIPPILRLELRGDRVFAGFCAFSLSLLIVGVFLSSLAREMFIDHLQATTSPWAAAQSLAAILSVATCTVVGGAKSGFVAVSALLIKNAQENVEPLQERANRLASRH